MEKPKLVLSGADGNAFLVVGLAKKAAKKAGWPAEKWEKVSAELMAGDYNHLLSKTLEHFDVE